jgi:cell division septation protein DedD
MMKKRSTNRENSIIIGTILASGIVFIFGFFLGQAWVTIPQEQVDTYQKSSGTPVVLTEEKSETPILPKKRVLNESVIKEKSAVAILSDKSDKLSAVQPKRTVTAKKVAVPPQKQQMVVQKIAEKKLAVTDKPNKIDKPAAAQPKQPVATKIAAAPPQKQQMVMQKLSEKKIAVSDKPNKIDKPAAAQPKQSVTAKKVAAPPQKQQVVQKIAEKKPAVADKSDKSDKPAAAQPKQPVTTKTVTALPQKQQVVQKIAEKKPAVADKSDKPAAAQPKQQEVTEKDETTQKKTEGRFVLQLGSFSDEAKSSALVSSLSAKGCSAYSSKMEMGDKGTWYRVYLSGIFKSREDAKQKGDSFKTQGIVGNYFIISSR